MVPKAELPNCTFVVLLLFVMKKLGVLEMLNASDAELHVHLFLDREGLEEG